MNKFENTARSNVIVFENVPFGNNASKDEVEILSAGIKGLHESGLDIQKVSFFEEPLEAIIHIKNAYTPSAKLAWLKNFSVFKSNKNSMMLLKIQVRRQLSATTPYLLKCELLRNLT